MQILLSEGYDSCGVAIDSAVPTGVISFEFSFIKDALHMVNPLKGDEPYFMSFKHFQYTFVHTLPLEEQKEAYEKLVVA